MTKVISSSVLAAIVLFASCADGSIPGKNSSDSTAGMSAATSSSDSLNANTSDTSNMSGADAKIVGELIQSMYGGIAVMKQAEAKAVTPAVKELAKKLDTEHSALTKELETLATKKGWSYPSAPTETDNNKLAELAKMDGKSYESDWLQTLKTKHETNIAKLEQHQTTDADLKDAAAKGLPKIKELLADIEKTQNSIKN